MSIQLRTLNYIMVFVSDMQRSTAFYRDLLGLPLQFSSPDWTEFATGSTTLALHLARDRSGGAVQGPSLAGQAQLGFEVDQLDAAYVWLQGQGVQFSRPPQEQPEGGKMAVLHDPDGLGITLRQG